MEKEMRGRGTDDGADKWAPPLSDINWATEYLIKLNVYNNMLAAPH